MPTRVMTVSPPQSGRSVLEILQQVLRLPRDLVLRTIREQGVRIAGTICPDPHRRLKAGQRVQIAWQEPRGERRPADRAMPRLQPQKDIPTRAHLIRVVYQDSHIVVVNKPSGLTTVRHKHEAAEFGHRAKKYLPTTLVDILPQLISGPTQGAHRLRAVHRIDKETSGLVVLARTDDAERNLGVQFRAHSIGRHYLALVRGKAKDGRIESRLVPNRGDGRRGSSEDPSGQNAITHVRVVEDLGEFALVECKLETGRTHQVRIHLGEAGTPLCGERVYDRPLNAQPPEDASGAKRPLLHAAYLEITHPASNKRMHWSAELPADMAAMLKKLRGREKG
ncbi:MAG: RluA family pseudouridine synthase [Gemmataceae bacterium]|nr:RluA family pseudouridine synthase [Gemmataceae bacterium]